MICGQELCEIFYRKKYLRRTLLNSVLVIKIILDCLIKSLFLYSLNSIQLVFATNIENSIGFL